MTVQYYGNEREVSLGDRVQVSVWFKKHQGRVVYVPGISPMNPEFEYNGLQWIGIRLDDGSLLASIVRPSTGALKRKIHFVRRDNSPVGVAEPSSREFYEKDEGAAL